jgi:lipid-binding SYLF domain-containing protein
MGAEFPKEGDSDMRKLLMLVPAVVVAGALSIPALATLGDKDKDDKYKSKDQTASDEAEKIHKAEAVLKASVAAPDKGIPRDLLAKAECVGVFPDVKKGAFVVGGTGGKGVFTCKGGNGMSGPAFFKIGGPSVGWQAGFEEADLILLIMNKEGVDKLLKDNFTIGAEAAAAAGPVGRNAKVSTDALMHAQIVSWSRSRGLFAGVSLDGLVIHQDKDDNADIYGKPLEAREILTGGSVPVPQVAKSFVNTAEQYTKSAS